MSSNVAPPRSAWPHRWAWALACATFPLVWWGGWVVASGSGMAFRDWLTSDGVAMPIYPWLSSVGDKFIEHGHRLLGMATGLLTIALLASCYVTRQRPGVKKYAWALLAGVVAQGALGGVRVVLDERLLALLHGATGPLFFAAAAGMVVLTSRSWETVGAPAPTPADRRLKRLAIICAGLAYAQLLLGVVVRHSALMIGDAAGRIFEAAAYLHVLVAVALVAHLIALAMRGWKTPGLRLVSAGLAALVVAQFTLGLAAWLVKYGLPGWATSLVGERDYLNREAAAARALIVTGHGAVGALIVALAVVAAMLAVRRVGMRQAAAIGAFAAAGRSFA